MFHKKEYDRTDAISIYEYSKQLIGHSLSRPTLNPPTLANNSITLILLIEILIVAKINIFCFRSKFKLE